MDQNNTIFDDVFRTLLEKMPRLVIPLINEVFGTAYDENTEITQLRNEHQTKDGRKITDSSLQLENKIYHIECQSNPDSTMVIRMVEYDFYIALAHAIQTEGKYRIEFPRTCVLYLRHNSDTKDELNLEIVFPQGDVFDYKVPVVKVQNYTKDVIFQRKLLFLLPFYIMRYEKEAERLEEDEEKLAELLDEYEEIRFRLEKSLGEGEHGREYTELVELIRRISDYIFRKGEKTRKGVGECMGGKVLELEVDKIFDRKEAEFNAKEAEFNVKEAEFNAKEAEFNTKEAEFNTKEAEFNTKEIKFNAKEAEFNAKASAKEEELSTKESSLNTKEENLKEKEEELNRREKENREKNQVQTLYSIAGFTPEQIAEKLKFTLDKVTMLLAG